MRIVPIFADTNADPPEGLYAVCFDAENPGLNEYDTLVQRLTDPEYLKKFFSTNKQQLLYGFYGMMDIRNPIQETFDEITHFEDRLEEEAEKGIPALILYLNTIFRPLDNNEHREVILQRSKTRGENRKSWLRVYALKVAPTFYLITGGGIKLVQYMAQDELLRIEKVKLERVRDFLREEGIADPEACRELIF